MAIPTTACSDCLTRLQETEILTEFERYVPEDEWDVSIEDLQTSAKGGCAICRIHLDAINNKHAADPGGIGQQDSSDPFNEVIISHRWLARGETAGYSADLTRLMISGEPFDVFTYPGDPYAKYVTNRWQKPPKSSPDAFATMNRWVTECTGCHGRERGDCSGSRVAKLPLRVIEISRDNDSSLKARLIDTCGENGRYAALSYCWGAEQLNPLRTTENNYTQHCQDIPIDTAPQTIRDAIITTERLGLTYLWIDALCIIQDSATDKDLQISKMGSIYEHAFVTLVAASAEHASCGFLSMPSQPKEIEFRLSLPAFFEGEPGTLYGLRGDSEHHMRTQPINLRAWTLEERLLSQRKLIFLTDRITWECRTVSIIDMGEAVNHSEDLRVPQEILRERENHKYDLSYLMWTVIPEWTKTIEWYSRRELSWPADKFRAIGGMARKYQNLFGGAYLAGIWEGFVLPGLLWRRIVVDGDTDGLRPRPIEYRAPSWSWAAIDGTIEYEQIEYEEGSMEVAKLGHSQSLATTFKATILQQTVQLSSPQQPFWGVIGGNLILQGLVKHVQGSLQPGTTEELGQVLKMDLRGTKNSSIIDCWPDAGGELPVGNAELDLLGLTGAAEKRPTSTKGASSSTTGYSVRGLILVTKDQGQYSRIGFFEYWSPSFEDLMDGFEASELDLI